jgi:hypothetical protein
MARNLFPLSSLSYQVAYVINFSFSVGPFFSVDGFILKLVASKYSVVHKSGLLSIAGGVDATG